MGSLSSVASKPAFSLHDELLCCLFLRFVTVRWFTLIASSAPPYFAIHFSVRRNVDELKGLKWSVRAGGFSFAVQANMRSSYGRILVCARNAAFHIFNTSAENILAVFANCLVEDVVDCVTDQSNGFSMRTWRSAESR